MGIKGRSIEKMKGSRDLFSGLIPWLMELGSSMPHSQGLSNNPYPEPDQLVLTSISFLNGSTVKSRSKGNFNFLLKSPQLCFEI